LYAARIVIGDFKPWKKWTQHVARIEGSEKEAAVKNLKGREVY
jgi:hypothetical protein